MATTIMAPTDRKARGAPREFARRLLDAVLQIPLVLKIMGANGIIVAVAAAISWKRTPASVCAIDS
jgi:hypothetical protein